MMKSRSVVVCSETYAGLICLTFADGDNSRKEEPFEFLEKEFLKLRVPGGNMRFDL